MEFSQAETVRAEMDWEVARITYKSNTCTKRPRPPPKPQNAITIAVSSQALFDMVEERKIYEEQSLEKYVEYQQANKNVTLKPGPAFAFVKVVEHVNA
ncbi:cytosolic 5'-nucleotidase 1B-like [Crotalus adamanteus]|uniref:Cytosolic 5'-nucleotidase 1B-like n=1 Tax=Crotalus adamanteus TaxID=8729 RepID=A0AAW1BIG2_CROAD